MKKFVLFTLFSLIFISLFFLAYSACTKTGNSLQSGSTQDGDTLLNGSVGNGDVALLDDETQLANSAYDLTKSLPLNYVVRCIC